MTLSKPIKLVIAAATTWPLLYFLGFIVFMFSMILKDFPASDSHPGIPNAIKIVFLLHFLTILWIIGLQIFYFIYLFKTDRVAKDMKVLWAVILFIGNMFAMPIFWYLYIWRNPIIAIPPKLP